MKKLSSDLVLHVKQIYFEQIESGEKKLEFREFKPYWIKRLKDRKYNNVKIYCAYTTKFLIRKWTGFKKTRIKRAFLGTHTIDVFAIDISKK